MIFEIFEIDKAKVQIENYTTNHYDLISIGVVEPVVAVIAVLQCVQGDELASGTATLCGNRGDYDPGAKVNDQVLVRVHFARTPGELTVQTGLVGLAGRRRASGCEGRVGQDAVLGAQRHRIHAFECSFYFLILGNKIKNYDQSDKLTKKIRWKLPVLNNVKAKS
jgi:hypothetical protein